MLEEIWKHIDNFPNYECSSMGRVRKNEKILKFSVTEKGYLHIRMYKDGKQYTFRVHRLVYMVFIGPIPDKMEINHLNGIKSDNSIKNLELTTRLGNMQHAVVNGLIKAKYGKDNSLSMPIVGTHLKTGNKIYFSGQCEAKRAGFNQGNIQSVLKGKRTHHKDYFWEYDPHALPKRQALIIDKSGTKPYT